MTENQSVTENVLAWLHEGYPEGVPPKDYFPLLALLKRSLSETTSSRPHRRCSKEATPTP
jgi:hypothetical protein